MNDANLPLVVLEVGRDTAHREAERILHDGIEIEVVVFVGQRRLLQVRRVAPIGVLLDELLPLRSPARRPPERAHVGGADRAPIRVDPQVAAADEVESRVIEVVVGPVVHRNALRGQPVPRVDVPGKQRRDAAARGMTEVVPADLPVVVRQTLGKRLRRRQAAAAGCSRRCSSRAARPSPAARIRRRR